MATWIVAVMFGLTYGLVAAGAALAAMNVFLGISFMPVGPAPAHALLLALFGGGVVVAWMLYPRSYTSPLEPVRGEYAFDAWLRISDSGVITIAVPQLEMGQGVTTLLPQVIAAELGADWRQIAVEPAPVSGAYANVPLAAKWSSGQHRISVARY